VIDWLIDWVIDRYIQSVYWLCRANTTRAIRRSPTETRRSKSRHVVCLVLSVWVEQYLWFVAWNEAVCENLVTDLSMEQRLAIKFCFKAGKSATEILQMVNAAYGDQALSRSTRCMGRRNLATAEKIDISEVSCEEHVGDFLRLARRNPIRICSGGWKSQYSVLQRCNAKAPKQNSTC